MNNNKSAFTLIELLVVIAIIALLLSILMPSLSLAKDIAKSVVCRSNQKQIGFATFMWSEDNDGWVPPAVWHSGGDGSNTLEPYTSAISDSDRKNLYSCPAVPERITKFCYGINSYLVSNHPYGGPGEFTYDTSGACDGWGPGCIYYGVHGNTKLINVRSPYSVMFYMDMSAIDPESEWGPHSYVAGRWNVIDEPYIEYYNSTPHRKDSAANFVFVDGHVETEPKDFRDNSSSYFLGKNSDW